MHVLFILNGPMLGRHSEDEDIQRALLSFPLPRYRELISGTSLDVSMEYGQIIAVGPGRLPTDSVIGCGSANVLLRGVKMTL